MSLDYKHILGLMAVTIIWMIVASVLRATGMDAGVVYFLGFMLGLAYGFLFPLLRYDP